MQDVTQRDRQLRHGVQLAARVATSGGQLRETTIANLSLDGCCVVGFFKIGDHIELHIPRIGKLTAQIRWTIMCRAGAKFVRRNSKLPLSDPETRRPLPSLSQNCAGVAAIEYALLAALIALTVVVSLGGLGGKVENNFEKVNRSVPGGMEFNNA